MIGKEFLRGFKYWVSNRIINWVPIHSLRIFWLKMLGANVSKTASIHLGVVCLGSVKNLFVGDTSVVNPHCCLDVRRGIHIGSNVSISREVLILTLGHDYNDRNFKLAGSGVKINDNAWVGARVVILPGVEIGEGCVIGANSTVTKSTQPWTVYAGNPARPIAKRKIQDFSSIYYRPFWGYMT